MESIIYQKVRGSCIHPLRYITTLSLYQLYSRVYPALHEGTHCEYQSLLYLQVPCEQHLGPAHPLPPHWPYNGEQLPVGCEADDVVLDETAVVEEAGGGGGGVPPLIAAT